MATAVDLYNNCSNGSLGMLSPIDFELAVNQIPVCEHPELQLYNFNKTREENSRLGFRRHKTMKINSNKKAVALNDKTTAGYSPVRLSLESCPRQSFPPLHLTIQS